MYKWGITYRQPVAKGPHTPHDRHTIKKLSPYRVRRYPQGNRSKKAKYAGENSVIHQYRLPTITTTYI